MSDFDFSEYSRFQLSEIVRKTAREERATPFYIAAVEEIAIRDALDEANSGAGKGGFFGGFPTGDEEGPVESPGVVVQEEVEGEAAKARKEKKKRDEARTAERKQASITAAAEAQNRKGKLNSRALNAEAAIACCEQRFNDVANGILNPQSELLRVLSEGNPLTFSEVADGAVSLAFVPFGTQYAKISGPGVQILTREAVLAAGGTVLILAAGVELAEIWAQTQMVKVATLMVQVGIQGSQEVGNKGRCRECVKAKIWRQNKAQVKTLETVRKRL